MSEVIERITRVLLDNDPLTDTDHRDVAREVIKAMRQPTPGMAREGGYMVPGHAVDADSAAQVWEAMIAEALGETE